MVVDKQIHLDISIGAAIAVALWLLAGAAAGLVMLASFDDAYHPAPAVNLAIGGAVAATIRHYLVRHSRLIRNAWELGRDAGRLERDADVDVPRPVSPLR